MSSPTVAKKVTKQVAVKKVAKKPTPATHPTYKEMVIAAIGDLKERKGSSRQAILKYIKGNYSVNDSADLFVKSTLVKGVTSSALVQVSGKGASGSFKLPKPENKKAAPKKKKVAAKKTAKKVVKKAASPKKAKKPAAKKASPKKAKKTVAKQSVVAKKKPAKKATVKTVKAKKPAAKKAIKKPAAKKILQKKK